MTGYMCRVDRQLEPLHQRHLSAVLETSLVADHVHCRGMEACLADHSGEGQHLQGEDVVVGSVL